MVAIKKIIYKFKNNNPLPELHSARFRRDDGVWLWNPNIISHPAALLVAGYHPWLGSRWPLVCVPDSTGKLCVWIRIVPFPFDSVHHVYI